MMMGTADEIVKSPEKGTVFVEDLPEEEQVTAVVSFGRFPLYTHHFLSCCIIMNVYTM